MDLAGLFEDFLGLLDFIQRNMHTRVYLSGTFCRIWQTAKWKSIQIEMLAQSSSKHAYILFAWMTGSSSETQVMRGIPHNNYVTFFLSKVASHCLYFWSKWVLLSPKKVVINERNLKWKLHTYHLQIFEVALRKALQWFSCPFFLCNKCFPEICFLVSSPQKKMKKKCISPYVRRTNGWAARISMRAQ